MEKKKPYEKIDTKRMTLAAMFLALAYVLPFLTASNPKIGSVLCLMHIPVLLCGFFCGAPWGALVGLLAPLLRAVTVGAPPLFPTAFCMMFELATYGFMAGFLHRRLPKKKYFVYASLLGAMLAGRLVWGVVMYICMGIKGGAFGMEAFLAGALFNAVPGILIQLILIPVLVIALERYAKSK